MTTKNSPDTPDVARAKARLYPSQRVTWFIRMVDHYMSGGLVTAPALPDILRPADGEATASERADVEHLFNDMLLWATAQERIH